MAKTPTLLPGREIKKMLAATRQMQDGMIKAVEELDAAIDRLPPGHGKRALRAEQDELKRQSGLFPEHEPPRSPRDDWPWEKFAAKAIELEGAARQWKAAGRFDKAQACLKEADRANQEATRRRTNERNQT